MGDEGACVFGAYLCMFDFLQLNQYCTISGSNELQVQSASLYEHMA